MKKILKVLFVLSIFSNIAIASTGFSTFWQYIESLPSGFLNSSATRSTILGNDITASETVKSEALNAKFGALREEINTVRPFIRNATIKKIYNKCMDGGCLAIVNGVTPWQSNPDNYLVVIEQNDMTIVTRGTSNAPHTTGNISAFDPTTYNTPQAALVKASDVTNFYGCSASNCVIGLNGVGYGNTAVGSYLVNVFTSSTAYITSRSFDTSTVYYAAASFNKNYYPTIETQRVHISDVTKFYRCSYAYCMIGISGYGTGQTTPLNYLTSSNGFTLSIVARGQSSTSAAWWSSSTYYTAEQTRVHTSDFTDFIDCSGYCLTTMTGVAAGNTASGSYLSAVDTGNAYIVYRYTYADPRYWSATTYNTNESSRISSSALNF